MPATPERMLHVADCLVGPAEDGGVPLVGLKLFLRDGSAVSFALPQDLANGLRQELERLLAELAHRPPPTGH